MARLIIGSNFSIGDYNHGDLVVKCYEDSKEDEISKKQMHEENKHAKSEDKERT